jgi:ATP-binding cassette subfamily B protein
VAQLRRAIGVIFQDFVRYNMRFDENIGVGEITETRAYLDSARETVSPGDVPPAMVTAAEKSLASSLLPRLPAGWRQMLGRRFSEGVELSGGE